MKHLLKIALGLVLCLSVFTACDDDDDNAAISGFSLSTTEVAANAEGGKETVTITSEGEWVAKSSEPWLSISPANGFGNTECVITIDKALKNTVREAEIRFMPKGQSAQVITVTQLGYDKMIYVKEQEVDIKASDVYEKRHFEAVITANVPFEIVYEWLTDKPVESADAADEDADDKKLKDWIWVEKKNEPVFNLDSARPKTYKVRFDWKMNPEWIEREVKINFNPIAGQTEASADEVKITPIHVTQAASPEITDDRAGDSLAILTMQERLLSDIAINSSENMMYWDNVTLWKRTDKDLPQDEDGKPIQEAIGRVRSVNLGTITTKESLPQEVRYLKYLETFQVYGNANTMLLSIDLESHICELKHLKNLQIGGYGLVSLPEDFKKLGNTLESLDISSNNFTGVPAVLTPENFPKLKKLYLNGNRRWTVSSLKEPGYDKDTELGFHMNLDENPTEIDALFLWENLEELVLSYNYLEGTLPTYEGRSPWTADDLKQYGDTCNYLLSHPEIPKILPNMKRLQLNLNFFTGKLPDWLLYHPHLLDWYPEVLIFNQQEMGINSEGKPVQFSNTPTNFEPYFTAYPKYRKKYEVSGEDETIKPEEQTK